MDDRPMTHFLMTAFTRQYKSVKLNVSLLLSTYLLLTACSIKTTEDINAQYPAYQPKAAPTAPNFKAIQDTQEKKQTFIAFIYPIAQEQNLVIHNDRAFIENLQLIYTSKATLTTDEDYRLQQLSTQYNVTYAPENPNYWPALLERINIIPPSLAVIQAALESGWGTSRFALEANNYFGQWCFKAGCGLIPNQRKKGKKHEVAIFEDVNDSVKRYMQNLNSFAAYQSLREKRRELQQTNQPITGLILAESLIKYSEKGQAYVDTVKKMIISNKIASLDTQPLPIIPAKDKK